MAERRPLLPVEGSAAMVTTGGPTTLAITGHSDPKGDPLQPIAEESGLIFVQLGSQFVLWPLDETTASAVFSGAAGDGAATTIAWLFDSKALAWVA